MQTCIYTCLFGDTDFLKDPEVVTPGCDYVCFTNNPNLKSDVWKIQLCDGHIGNKRLSRWFKILPPEGYDQTLYVDATFRILRDLTPLLKSKTEGVYLFKHPQRNCAYKEAEVVKDKKLDDERLINAQVANYQTEGFPENYGLWRCGILIRDSRNAKLNETWLQEVESYSWRDQISFPYACWKTGTTPKPILASLTDHYFEQSLHKTHLTDDWKHFGTGVPNWDITLKHQLAHLIVTEDNLYFPAWLNNYVGMSFGRERFIELVRQLNGDIVYV